MSTAEKIDARYAILASLPLPSGVPEDSLTPILIPAPHTLHDFIGTTSGVCAFLGLLRYNADGGRNSFCGHSPCLPFFLQIILTHIYRLGNYRVFQQSTTTWCPDREEHGYYLTPVFKCNTNPRVSTAHKWTAVDFTPKLDKPTGEWFLAVACFQYCHVP